MSKTHSESVPPSPSQAPSPLIQATVLLVSWLDFQPPMFLALPNIFCAFQLKWSLKIHVGFCQLSSCSPSVAFHWFHGDRQGSLSPSDLASSLLPSVPASLTFPLFLEHLRLISTLGAVHSTFPLHGTSCFPNLCETCFCLPFRFSLFFLFWPHQATCKILGPQPGI